MAITYQRFITPQLLSSTDVVLFTVPITPVQTVMKSLRLRLANTSAAAATASLNVVPAGGAVAASNNCLPAVSIAPNDYIDVDVPDMAAGDALHAIAGTANVISVTQLDGFLKS
jgi:hypothetical protein